MTRRRPSLAVAAAAALLLSTGGCAVIGPSDGYTMTVFFAKTPSLYKMSRVKVMGANVGSVEDLRTEGDRVRVRLRIDSSVPVPADVHATIAAQSAIGERSVILYPPWTPGQPKAPSGSVIPLERTEPSVEIDDALAAFTRLAESVDPTKVKSLVRAGADLLDGRGTSINDGLTTVAGLSEDLAGQDEKIVSVAKGLRDLSSSLNKRDARLRALIDSFASVSGQLADERTRLRSLLVGIEALIRTGDVIVTAYREKLPKTVAQTSSLVMTLKANSGSIAEAISGLARFTDLAVGVWDRKHNVAVIRTQLNATLRIWLQPIFDLMGWGRVPCLDKPIGNCPKTVVRKRRP